jgi:transcriptional regulator with XRE-family HTH domain
MKLHEKIYTLRTAKNLSQGDLAEILDVSRQSVSKWETGASIPDLDKLIKMSDLFGVSLDALVREKMPENEQKIKENSPKTPENGENPQNIVIVKEPFPTRKIMGFIFFGMAFIAFLVIGLLADIIAGLCLAAFFSLLGIICFVSSKRPLYWCICALFLVMSALFPHSVGIQIPLIMLVLYIPMLIWTLYEFRHVAWRPSMKQKVLFWILWGFYLVSLILPSVLYRYAYHMAVSWKTGGFLLMVWQMLVNPIFLAVLVVFTAAWIRAHREKK